MNPADKDVGSHALIRRLIIGSFKSWTRRLLKVVSQERLSSLGRHRWTSSRTRVSASTEWRSISGRGQRQCKRLAPSSGHVKVREGAQTLRRQRGARRRSDVLTVVTSRSGGVWTRCPTVMGRPSRDIADIVGKARRKSPSGWLAKAATETRRCQGGQKLQRSVYWRRALFIS